MKSYYYPIISKDFTFENIFSSESISPPVFYSKRGFGIPYWPVLPGYQSEDVIVLYDEIPAFETENTEAVQYVLEIYEAALDPSCLQEIDGGIFFYLKTIYLGKPNFKVIFFSERDRMLTLLRSETSLPTKDLLKYRANFVVANEGKRKRYERQDLRVSNAIDSVAREIQFDRKFNFFKGFIYGVAVGLLANSVPRELFLKKRLREISNRFSEFSNRVETNKQVTQSPKTKDDAVLLLMKELSDLFDKTCDLVSTLFPRPNVTDTDLETYLLNQYPKDFEEISPRMFLAYKRLDDKIFNRNEYQKIVSRCAEQHNQGSPLGTFLEIKHYLEEYYGNVLNFQQKNGHRRRDAVDAFKSSLSSFESFVDKQIAERSTHGGFDLSSIRYDVDNTAVTFTESFSHSSSVDLQELSKLMNIVLGNPRQKNGPVGRDIHDIVDHARTQLLDGNMLTEFHSYLSNESKYFYIENISSVVLKNFVAFVLNPDSIEKLSSFGQSKNLKEQWIGYALWCSYNGFANIPRNFLRPVFDADGNALQEYIDFYLFQIFNVRTMQDYILNKNHGTLSTMKLRDDLEILYKRYFATINGMSREKFMNLLNTTDRSKFIKILRDNFHLSKNEGTHLFEMLSNSGMNRLL